MTTVFQCVKELGLAHSPLVLNVLGNVIKSKMSLYLYYIPKGPQQENGELFIVNQYPDEYKSDIKKLILSFITEKQPEWRRRSLAESTRKYKAVESIHFRWNHQYILKRV